MSTELDGVEAETQGTWIKSGEAGLYMHGPTGKYYSRFRLNGKRTFLCTDTSVYSIAKLRHKAKMMEVEEQRQVGRPSTEMRTMGDLLAAARKDVEDSNLEPSTKRHYRMRFDQLEKHWPAGDLSKFAPSRVGDATVTALRNKLLKGLAPASTNQVLQTLANLMATARRLHLAVYNPFDNQDRQHRLLAKVVKTPLVLPTKADVERIFQAMETLEENPQRIPQLVEMQQTQAINAAEHARFLTYLGARWKEGNRACWEDIKGDLIYVRGTKTEASKAFVPILPALRDLLEKMRVRRVAMGLPLTGPILLCQGSKVPLKKACARLGIAPLNHHKLRHLFATIAIESNVPIVTVASWLRHADRGVLAMQTYGHLRNEHSIEQAKNVSFLPSSTPQATSG
jgi:integrase